MKRIPKLRRFISVSLWGLALCMIVAYSILVEYSIITGMDEQASYQFHLTARDFALEYRENPDARLPEEPRLKSYIGEKELPDWFKNNYKTSTQPHAKIQWDEGYDLQEGQEGYLFFVAFPYDLHDGKRLYLIETFTEDDDIPGTFSKTENSDILTLGIGIGFIVLIMAVLRYMFKKVSDPMEALSDWANTLTPENLSSPPPDFKFDEINRLAALIRNAVQDLNQALTREHQFLRFSSHELRTPIAVLRSNMDLMERLRPDPGENEKSSFLRMRRALDNMHRMTETLLWLSRKEEKMPAWEPVDIGDLVDELTRENKYLLEGKKVKFSLESVPVRITIPRAAARIVIGNLIRNAFQYTVRGEVGIRVTEEAFTVINTDHTLEDTVRNEDDYGFGLGLMLVAQITEKLNLRYENMPVPGGHKAIIFFEPVGIS